MNLSNTVMERTLNRTEFRWKWLRFLRWTFGLGYAICLALLMVGAGVVWGVLTNRALVVACLGLIGVLGFLALLVLTIAVAAQSPDRNWLASTVERIDNRLMDRLHALLFLERKSDAAAQGFATRIARQAHQLLLERPSRSPFSHRPILLALIVFALLLIGTVSFYSRFSPVQRLAAAERKALELTKKPSPSDFNLPPATNQSEQLTTWGEVRITEPGSDLKVTKIDVVPLQIEAAASQPLDKVIWYSTVNGSQETAHELGPPPEPRYAVYQPLVFLDELRLSDWDLVTYFAKGSTTREETYASEVYFLEVRPFREDILKMPGGEGGKAYQTLNEISGLIRRQQHIIRETHQHAQRAPALETVRTQDRKKLADAEKDMAESSRHLYASMATELENQPIGDVLDCLARAGKSLDEANLALQDDELGKGQERERTALADLVSARKTFQKAVSDNPDAFQEKNGESDELPPPVAQNAKKLSEMAEFRNEAKAAKDFVDNAAAQQRELEEKIRSGARRDYPGFAGREEQLRDTLRQFQEQHPQVFKPTENEMNAALDSLDKAGTALRQKGGPATASAQQATRELEALARAIGNQTAEQQLADAYKLKRMLDSQVKNLDRAAQPGNKVPDKDLKDTAGDARETVKQLKHLTEQQPTKQAFAQPLRDALSSTNQANLEEKLSNLERTGSSGQISEGGDREQKAAEARDALGKVSQAFAASQPKSLQMAQSSDSVNPDPKDAFGQGMAELDSLIKQLEKRRALSTEDQARQGGQALYDLQTGMRNMHGDNSSGNQILLQLQQMLKAGAPLDVENLKKLLEQLQHFSVETSEKRTAKDEKAELTNIDPSKLPPAYRGRIQKYFQRLSE